MSVLDVLADICCQIREATICRSDDINDADTKCWKETVHTDLHRREYLDNVLVSLLIHFYADEKQINERKAALML